MYRTPKSVSVRTELKIGEGFLGDGGEGREGGVGRGVNTG